MSVPTLLPLDCPWKERVTVQRQAKLQRSFPARPGSTRPTGVPGTTALEPHCHVTTNITPNGFMYGVRAINPHANKFTFENQRTLYDGYLYSVRQLLDSTVNLGYPRCRLDPICKCRNGVPPTNIVSRHDSNPTHHHFAPCRVTTSVGKNGVGHATM